MLPEASQGPYSRTKSCIVALLVEIEGIHNIALVSTNSERNASPIVFVEYCLTNVLVDNKLNE